MRGEPRDDAKPPTELAALDYFVGAWSWKGQVFSGPEGPGRDIRGTTIYRWELGKFYLGVAEDDEQILRLPRRRQHRSYWGYDPGAKLYTRAMFFFGGARLIDSSPGWRGNTLTYGGEMVRGAEHMQTQHSMMRVSDDEMTVRCAVVGPDGALTQVLEQTCQRERDDD